jgi:D-alanine-D-alanine ligase-like ATP-grasp enzyme
MSIQSMSLALRLVKYAAGNTYDQNPVVLVDASALNEAENLMLRVPNAWARACSLVPASMSVSQRPCVNLPNDASAAVVIAEFSRALFRLYGHDQGRLIHFLDGRGINIAGVALPGQSIAITGMRAAAYLLVRPVVSSEVQRDLEALRHEAWLVKGTWASAVATRLDIPWRIAASIPNPFVVLGQGCHQKSFWLHMPGTSGYIGSKLSDDKRLSSQLLRRAGLPAPQQREVKDLKEAVNAAESMGWPVVVKPATGYGGKGVTARIMDRGTLTEAFTMAAPYGSVLVEKHIEGHHHRIAVIRGQCVSALRFEPGHVVGDGYKTVSELLTDVNASRTDEVSSAGKKIQLDDNAFAMLRRQGFSIDDVPEAGLRVALRSQSNLSSGGTYTDVTQNLHPDTKRLAETAARLFDLDVCGVDVITPDATKSWLEVGGGINEVNKNPSYVLGGDENKWADRIVGSWFSGPTYGRVPTVVVLVRQDKREQSDLAKRVAEVMCSDDTKVAIASNQAISFGSVRSRGPDLLQHQVAAALADPVAVALVIVASADEIVRYGLGLDRCDVVIVTSGIKDKDAPAVKALARLSNTVVMSHDAPPEIANLIQSASLVLAASSDDAGLLAALSSVLRLPCKDVERNPSQNVAVLWNDQSREIIW